MMQSEKTPKDKYELRDYLLEIDLDDPKQLEALAEEIVGNIFEAMDCYRQMPDDHPLKIYYETPFKEIELGYACKDFKRTFPRAIKHLLMSIKWE
jgi:DNA primase large subunit